jgi:hypothetical protein
MLLFRYWEQILKQEVGNEEEQENGERRQPSSKQVTQGTGSDSLARLRTSVTNAMTLVDQDSPSSHFGT